MTTDPDLSQGRRFHIVGMGPGSPDYLTPAAGRVIDAAEVLIGSRRHLAPYFDRGKTLVELSGGLSKAAEQIRFHRRTSAVAVLVSGDPGFHSLLGSISRRFDADEYTVVPGISSMQLGCARIGICWQDAVLMSVHGKTSDRDIGPIPPDRVSVFLTDASHNPAHIAASLMDTGHPDRRAWILENLSYEDERITKTRLSALPGRSFSSLCIMIIDTVG